MHKASLLNLIVSPGIVKHCFYAVYTLYLYKHTYHNNMQWSLPLSRDYKGRPLAILAQARGVEAHVHIYLATILVELFNNRLPVYQYI